MTYSEIAERAEIHERFEKIERELLRIAQRAGVADPATCIHEYAPMPYSFLPRCHKCGSPGGET